MISSRPPGVYSFNRLRAWLAHDNAPVHLDLPFYFNDLVDHTPAFHKAAYVLEVGGQRAEMPKWGDAQLALNWPDGSTGDAVGWLAEGVSAWRFTTQNGHLTLPAGVYHRVDVRRTVADWPAKLRAVADAADVLAKTLRAAADTVAGQ